MNSIYQIFKFLLGAGVKLLQALVQLRHCGTVSWIAGEINVVAAVRVKGHLWLAVLVQLGLLARRKRERKNKNSDKGTQSQLNLTSCPVWAQLCAVPGAEHGIAVLQCTNTQAHKIKVFLRDLDKIK